MRLIDKDALIENINRRIKVLRNKPYENYKTICHLDSLKQSINTLEMKDVDFEKEIQALWSLNQKSADSLFILMNYNGLRGIAKHFFELGLKAQKREEI